MFILRRGDRTKIWLGITVSLLMFGCGENKYTQCEQIFQIAHRVVETNNNAVYISNEQPSEMKSWLQAADIMAQAAQQIKALPLNDIKLIEYQTGLVNIYRIYSQATYDAVKARESKNIEALQTAHSHAAKAGEIQKKLIKEINAYCVNQNN